MSLDASQRPPPARWLPALGLLVLTACVSTRGHLPGTSSGGEDPWELDSGSFPSQRLYRVKYEGPEGKASFKLTLYLATSSHYRMAAADSLGRKLWSLQVDESGQAVWLDHRDQQYCRVQGADRLVVVPLARLPLAALPRLLLGRLPAEPVANLRRGPDHLSYLDIRGQRWTAALRAAELDWWSVEDLGEAVAWWRRDGDGGDFSDVRGGQRVTWRQIVVEAVAPTLVPLEIPPRFRPGACGESSRG